MAEADTVPPGYDALRSGVAWHAGGSRATVVVAGADAVRFIDGFTTAAIGRLPEGEGTEGFFPDARGQVLSLATIFRAADGLWIDAERTPPSEGAAAADRGPTGTDGWSLAAHLDRYHIRERLRIVDRSGDVATFLVAGPAAAEWVAGATGWIPTSPTAHDAGPMESFAAGVLPRRLGGVAVAIGRGPWLGPGTFLLVVAAADRDACAGQLRAAGIPEAGREAVEAVRLESAWPAAVDVPPRTLPQELGRTGGISFTKGCYLGQETVARIDALGHVNRRAVVLASAPSLPLAAGMAVEVGGEGVGTITSAARSPRRGGWLAMALVRTAALEPGTAITAGGGRVRPVLPEDPGPPSS